MHEAAMAKKTKITIETDTLLVLRGRNSLHARRPLCAAEAEMVALGTLGVLSDLEPAMVEEWLNSQELHCSQAVDGSQLICLNSLLGLVRKENR